MYRLEDDLPSPNSLWSTVTIRRYLEKKGLQPGNARELLAVLKNNHSTRILAVDENACWNGFGAYMCTGSEYSAYRGKPFLAEVSVEKGFKRGWAILVKRR